MRELENQKMRKWGTRLCQGNEAVPQKSNKIKATPCKPAEVLSVYLTLAKVVARQAINFAKVCTSKTIGWGYQEDSEDIGEERKIAERDFGEKRL